MAIKTKILSVLSLSLILAGCLTSSNVMRHETARRLASPSWMVERQIPAGQFSLTAYERMHERYESANIYIEGEGLYFPREQRLSDDDPTPLNPVALHLASRDKAENVVYLARPCQYIGGGFNQGARCDASHTIGDKRFSPSVIASYNAALDEIKRRYDIEGYHLVGFSGGGGLAAILAAERDDILSLRTVAGNLDHRVFSNHHERPPLTGSQNPRDAASSLTDLPQYHFIGGQDEVVPPAVLHSYLQALGPSSCVQYQLIQEAEHTEGWVDKWPELLARSVSCLGPSKTPPESFEMILPEPFQVSRELPDKP